MNIEPPDRNPEEFIAALRKAHEKYPDLRIGQLIVNAVSNYYGPDDELIRRGLYNAENYWLKDLVKAFSGESL